MRLVHPTFLLSCAMLTLWSSASPAGEFCVDSDAEYRDALALAAENHEDDIIMIVEGAEIAAIAPRYETGYSLRIETGYDALCSERPPTASGQMDTGGSGSVPATIPEPQISTSGPQPFAAESRRSAASLDENSLVSGQETVLGVPAYRWRHGCAPTALAMLLGYWDLRGMIDLFPGSAVVENETIRQAMASADHYDEYSLPYDATTNSIKEDLSEQPELAHADDSLADYLHTSWSADNLRYGWTSSARIIPALQAYTASRNPDYEVEYRDYYMVTSYHAFDWNILTDEIDHGRPMIFLVDTTADGFTDHFITVIGYRSEPTLQYASLDTWDNSVHWHDFNKIASGTPWGIWGAWSYEPNSANMAAEVDQPSSPIEPSIPDVPQTTDPEITDTLQAHEESDETIPEPVVEEPTAEQRAKRVAVLNIISKLLLKDENS